MSRFLRIKCTFCGYEQVIFGNAGMDVLCLVCGRIVGISTGGKTEILAKIVEVMDEPDGFKYK